MPFKDSKEGQTHYQNDGCGEPEHNDIMSKEKIIVHFQANFLDGETLKNSKGTSFTASGGLDIAEYFYELGKQQGREEALKKLLEKGRGGGNWRRLIEQMQTN